MKEYIDREAARDLMEQALVDEWEIQYADDRLDEIPTADVVERNPIKTNADRVRAMTDEELAEWYWWMLNYVRGATDSRTALLDWLKQEVESDES